MTPPALGFVVPGGPVPRTGGTLYNRALAAASLRAGHPVREIPLTGRWPLPTPAQLARFRPVLGALPVGLPLLIDGLLWTGLAPLHDHLVAHHPCTVLVHSPLFRETGLRPGTADDLRTREAHALARAHRCIATGGPTLRDLAQHFDQTAACLPPGTRRVQPVAARDPLALATVASLTPRKGHDRLFRALHRLSDVPWHLTCAGSATLDPRWVQHLRALAHQLGIAHRISLVGELGPPGLEALWATTGLLVHGAHYEAWGMALSEAIARGVPVVSTPAGALEGPCAAAAAGLDAAGDPDAWAEVLRAVVTERHGELRTAARRIHQPDWDETAAQLWSLLAR